VFDDLTFEEVTVAAMSDAEIDEGAGEGEAAVPLGTMRLQNVSFVESTSDLRAQLDLQNRP